MAALKIQLWKLRHGHKKTDKIISFLLWLNVMTELFLGNSLSVYSKKQ